MKRFCNSLKRNLLFGCFVSVLFSLPAFAQSLVKPGNVTRIDTVDMRYVEVEARKWVEIAKNDAVSFRFDEVKRDASSVLLYDSSRNVHLKMDLQSRQIFYYAGTDEASKWVLRQISEVGVDVAQVSRVDFASGRWRMDGPRSWVEERADGTVNFRFVEQSRDATSIYIFDASRGLRLQMDVKTAKAYWSAPADGPKNELLTLTAISSTPEIAMRFAPQLRFDRAAKGYPMSAQVFYDQLDDIQKTRRKVQNVDKASLADNSIPTYYQIRRFGGQTRIQYWWFYGFQDPCMDATPGSLAAAGLAGGGLGAAIGGIAGAASADSDGHLIKGDHHGDWENIIVILSEDETRVASVSYFQHGGWYTRIAGPRDAPCTAIGRCDGPGGFETVNGRPVVYVGKIAHGSFHNSNSVNPQIPGGQCLYYEDYRNPAGAQDYFETPRAQMVNLDGNVEPWLAADRIEKIFWGPKTGRDSAISTQPTAKAPTADMKACTGNAVIALSKEAGCYKSECLAGDDQPVGQCLKECKPGFTNTGLTCFKWDWFESDSYGRLGGGNPYPLSYVLPTRDVGLSRRRFRDLSEWTLP
jgi:hypothetical protein